MGRLSIFLQPVYQNTLFMTHIDDGDRKNLVAGLRHQRMEHTIGVTVGSGVVKLDANLFLAIVKRGPTEWSRAINGKYLLRLNESHFQM